MNKPIEIKVLRLPATPEKYITLRVNNLTYTKVFPEHLGDRECTEAALETFIDILQDRLFQLRNQSTDQI